MSPLAELRSWWRRRRSLASTTRALTPPEPSAFAAFGKRSLLLPPARVESPECIRVGEGSIIHEHSWLCVQQRPGLAPPSLVIGDRTSINRFAKIVCQGQVTVGSGVILADRVYISDVEHEPVPDGPPILTEPRPVVVHDDVFIGVGAVIKPGVTVGKGAYVGGGAVVHDDVAPHSLVVGSPARVVRVADGSGRWVRPPGT